MQNIEDVDIEILEYDISNNMPLYELEKIKS